MLEEAAKLDLESVIIVGITRKGGLHVRTYMPHTDALVACEVLRKRLLDKLDSGEGDWP